MLSLPLRARIAGLIVMLGVLMLDQWSKTALLAAAQAGEVPRSVLPFFNLVLVHNRGVSFGFLAGMQTWMPLALTLVTSAVAFALVIWLARAESLPLSLALGLIIGGALGNIVDRARLGSVTDFLDFHLGSHHWPAFNLADSAIFSGVVILALISIVMPSDTKENTRI